MVNIEQPLASDTSHVLREMLQNKENVFQAHANTNSDAMQECGENATKSDNVIIGGRHNDTVSDHSDRSEGSIDGSDEESSSLEQTRMDETEVGDSKYEADDDKFVEDSVPDNNKDITRARLENINTSVHNPFIDPELGGYGVSEIRRAKRKQNYPQQHESNAKMPKTDGHFEDEFWQYNQRFNSMQNYFKHLSETAKQLNGYSSLDELHRLQQAYLANLHARTTEDPHTNNNIFKSAAPLVTKTENRRPSMDDPFSIAETVREKVNSNKRLNDKVTDLDEKELQLLISNLKSKIEDAVSSTVDKELNKFFQKRNDELKQDEIKKQNYLKEQLQNNHVNREIRRENEPEKKTTDHSLDHILQMPSKPPATNGFPLPGRHSAFELPKISGRIPEIPRAPFPHPPPLGYPPLSFYLPPTLHGPSMYSCPLVPPEQTEALALVVNTPQKKKRTKVTDTRLSPRAARALLHENGALDQDRPMSGFSPMTASCLPTSVAIPNPSLHHSDILSFYKDQSLCRSPMDPERHSPSSSHSPSEGFGFMKGDYFNDGDTFDSNGKITDTLTPMHLRKAKLMFFYVRYPSSAIIKVYFPDVQFNKNNTAQLVKWFSNFREFYYIQMEKYARQAIAEGCKHAEDLVVGTDSELYRTLNLHYNRNNQIDVPDNFRLVVQATLREFFAALMANKDSEPSWKKPIYKVIARMDDILPEYFKSPNWMDQLGDA